MERSVVCTVPHIGHRKPSSRAARCLVAAFTLALASTLAAQSSPPTSGLINRAAVARNARTGSIYVVDSKQGSVTVIDRNGVASAIKTGAEPISIAINERTNKIYVANAGDHSVTVIDGATNEPIASAKTAARPYAIALDQVTNRVFVSNTFSNMLTVIDGATIAVHNVRSGSADALLVDYENAKVYLLGYESDALTVFDEGTETTSKLPAGAMHLWGLAQQGSTLFVTHMQDSTLAAIDTTQGTLRIARTVFGAKPDSPPTMPNAIALDAAHNLLYVANYAGSVSAIDTHTLTPLWTLSIGGRPQALAIDPAAHRLYVADAQGHAVTIVDTSHQRVLRKLPLQASPYALLADPTAHRVVAATATAGLPSFVILPAH